MHGPGFALVMNNQCQVEHVFLFKKNQVQRQEIPALPRVCVSAQVWAGSFCP